MPTLRRLAARFSCAAQVSLAAAPAGAGPAHVRTHRLRQDPLGKPVRNDDE